MLYQTSGGNHGKTAEKAVIAALRLLETLVPTQWKTNQLAKYLSPSLQKQTKVLRYHLKGDRQNIQNQSIALALEELTNCYKIWTKIV